VRRFQDRIRKATTNAIFSWTRMPRAARTLRPRRWHGRPSRART